MNAWNQWGAAAYPAAIPGYAAPQATATPTLPGAAAALPPAAAAAAAAAVPYPAMPGFQAWPYAAAAPQALTPWGTPAAAAPAGQAAQWDQWNQWHQQYSQWQQQQYAAHTIASTPQTAQAHTTISTAKAGLQLPQAATASTAPTMATNTTTTATPQSGNVKRPNDAPADSQMDTKKPKMDQAGWNQQQQPQSASVSSNPSKELEELSEAEKQFDEQFKSWEAQFDTWRRQNANHPDIEQYKAYEAKWALWREQLLSRREQMKKKREKLTEAAASQAKPEPLAQPPDPSTVLNTATAVTAMPQMYPGAYSTPNTTVTAPSSQYQSQYPQGQSTFVPSYMPPAVVPQPQAQPTSTPSTLPTQNAAGSVPQEPPQAEFLKSSSTNGIPGLDLLGGASSQADSKALPAVSFASSTQLPIQTPADSKPFDFPPPRQAPPCTQQPSGYPGQTSQIPPTQGTLPPTGAPPAGYGGGMMQPPGFPTFPGQPQTGASFQGPPPTGYQSGFPGYQSNVPGSGYQGPPSSGYQPGQTPPVTHNLLNQSQAPSSGYQPPGGFQGQGYQGQPPPGGFPPPIVGGGGGGSGPYMPPGPAPFQSGFPPGGPPQSGGFPNQQGPPSNYQDPSQGGFSSYQQPPTSSAQGHPQQFPPPNNQDPKKIPGLMDNVSNFSDRPSTNADNRGDAYNRNNNYPDDKFGNKFPQDRFGNQEGKDRFGDKGPNRYGGNAVPSKDNISYSIPKPKGYFSLQEMSEEEEYEKFHEYQQGGVENEEDERRAKFEKSKSYDDSRSFNKPRYDDHRHSRFDDGKQSKFDDQRSSRFDDNKPSRFEGPRPSRFDGGRPSRFEDQSPNKFSQDIRGPEQDNFNRSFENDNKNVPSIMGNPPLASPSKGGGRSTRWGAPENEMELETGSGRVGDRACSDRPIGDRERRPQGGGLGPPYGATPDGCDFMFATIVDYNHTPANLGVPHYFEPISIIDYTHGLNGIKIEEPIKEPWDNKIRGGRGGSPPAWSRDERERAPRDDRGDLDDRNRRQRPDDRRPDDRRPDDRRPDDRRESRGGPMDRERGPPGGPRWGEPDDRDRNRRKSGSRDESQSSFDRIPRSPDRGRISDRMSGRDRDNDRDRRDRDRDRKEPDRDRDRDNRAPRSRSPPKDVKQDKPAEVAPPPTLVEREVVLIDDLLSPPGRLSRPSKIVVFIRGPPGSGKSYLAKLIKDKEVKNGGTAPRILSLDDYFMTDVEKEEVDADSGRLVKKKVMEYEFDPSMELKYRESLNKCFRKTVTDGYFPFIIIDANNDKVSYFDSMVNFCKVRGFNFYVIDMEQDPAQCIKRNTHNRSEKDIQNIMKGFEPTPPYFPSIDIRSLLQEAAIPEVDMEDSMDVATPDAEEGKKVTDDKAQDIQSDEKKPEPVEVEEKDEDKEIKQPERGFARFTISSKWDDLDSSVSKLDRLDGWTAARKSRPTIQDWLQVPDEASYVSESSSVGSKKRVRWADVEERSKQAKMKAMGFVVGHTDWSRMMDPTSAESKLTQTKYI